MVRIPPWIHKQAANRGWATQDWHPGWHGTGMQLVQRPPITWYNTLISGVPLTGGQAVATVSVAGTATVTIGPQGLGTTWYPTQVTISTSTGANDNSTAQIFLGSKSLANLMVGQSYAAGQDTVAIAVPPLTPGALLICAWTGGHRGDTAVMNIVGTMDVLSNVAA